MARIAGRSNWAAWPVGVSCLVVVVALAWLSQPLIPGAVQWVGDALRGPTSGPVADAAGPGATAPATAANPATDVSACRALYTSALWSELTARTGGDPTQDAAAPSVSASSVVAALSPVVRETCTWTAVTTGTIVTTLATVEAGSSPIAEAALASAGFSCAGWGDGVRCTRTDGDEVQDIAVRGGIWLSSTLRAWHPNLYTERIAEQLWPQ